MTSPDILFKGGGAKEPVKTVVLIDILGSLDRYLLREPRNLWDAYGISIMAPVVGHAKRAVTEICKFLDDPRQQPKFNFLQMRFNIPRDVAPHMTDWSYSNMSKLFQIGRDTGKAFWEKYGKDIGLKQDPRPRRQRIPAAQGRNY